MLKNLTTKDWIILAAILVVAVGLGYALGRVTASVPARKPQKPSTREFADKLVSAVQKIEAPTSESDHIVGANKMVEDEVLSCLTSPSSGENIEGDIALESFPINEMLYAPFDGEIERLTSKNIKIRNPVNGALWSASPKKIADDLVIHQNVKKGQILGYN